MDKIDYAYRVALKDIDFDKIQDYMDRVNWVYAGDINGVTIAALIHKVDSVYNSAKESFLARKTSTMCSSGGFQVNIWDWGEVQISFIIQDSYSFFEVSEEK